MATIEFWYEFASTYSYPAAMRIEQVAAENGVNVNWLPFLLGPIFNSQGWDTSPFLLYREKGEYMWRDMERICKAMDLEFQPIGSFPQNSLLAARLALTPEISPKRTEFSRQVYQLQFARGKNIFDRESMEKIIQKLGLDEEIAFQQAQSHEIKQALRINTETAKTKKIFGAPSFVTPDGELFWGNDRLEQAVAWACG